MSDRPGFAGFWQLGLEALCYAQAQSAPDVSGCAAHTNDRRPLETVTNIIMAIDQALGGLSLRQEEPATRAQAQVSHDRAVI